MNAVFENPGGFLFLSEELSGIFAFMDSADKPVFSVCGYSCMNTARFPIGVKALCWRTILRCKVKMHLTPCAVAVCLIPVACGGVYSFLPAPARFEPCPQPGSDSQIRCTDRAGGQDQFPVAFESGWKPDFPCRYDGRGQKKQGRCFFRSGGDFLPSCLRRGYRVPNPMPRGYGPKCLPVCNA